MDILEKVALATNAPAPINWANMHKELLLSWYLVCALGLRGVTQLIVSTQS